MFYFKKIHLDNLDKEKIEKSIRSNSVKRHTSLDTQSSAYLHREDNQQFLGLEKDSNIQLVRIRTRLERLLPKIIIRFNKADYSNPEIRLSLLSTFVLLLLLTSLVVNVAYSIDSNRIESDLLNVVVIPLVYCFLIGLEVKLTIRRLNKIFQN